MMARLKASAAKFGLTLGDKKMTCNSWLDRLVGAQSYEILEKLIMKYSKS